MTTFDSVIEQTLEWEDMTAYDRAKLYCHYLMRNGQALPSWNAIREHIGKGSASDINRAKSDFRNEHAQKLRQMEGFQAKGVPESVSPHVVALWQAAVKAVSDSFTQERNELEEKITQSELNCEAYTKQLEQANSKIERLEQRIQSLEETKTILEGQVQTESSARKQAEKMADNIKQDMSEQRKSLDEALAKSHHDLELAITRLESTEKRSLVQIDRARQAASDKVSELENKYVLELARLNKQLSQVQENNASLAKAKQDLEIQLTAANTSLEQLDKHVETLKSNNNNLVLKLLERKVTTKKKKRPQSTAKLRQRFLKK